MKKHIILISVGILNVLHATFHIIQFVQSAFLVAYATHHNHGESWVEKVMHNPVFALFMGIIGVATLIIGIKDFKHHKKCNSKKQLNNIETSNLTLEQQLEIKMKEVKELSKEIHKKNKTKESEFIYWN